MSEANKKQVGGTHYQAAYQHWDFAMDYNLCHLAAAATKYLTRYMKKNGKQDVEKAAHYIEKWIERCLSMDDQSAAPVYGAGAMSVHYFLEVNNVIDNDAALAVIIIVDVGARRMTWGQRASELRYALQAAQRLLTRLEAAG